MSYYLYTHPNKHAPIRSNGIRFWGYPVRNGLPAIIVVHTAENRPDYVPPDTGAESVARYFSRTERPASAHVVTDSDSVIPLIPDTAVAFHVRGYNTPGWGIEIATQAASWNALPNWHKEALLRNAARVCAETASKWGIPVAYRTKAQIDSGLPGFTGHTDLDPSRRRDPGFDDEAWDQFIGYVKEAQEDNVPQFTEHEVEQLKNLVRSLDVEESTGWGFAKWGSRLIDKERSLPLHAPSEGLSLPAKVQISKIDE